MGLLGKLKFWKKEDDSLDDLGLGGGDLGSAPGTDPFGGANDPFASAGDNPFSDMPMNLPGQGMRSPQGMPPMRPQMRPSMDSPNFGQPGFGSQKAQQQLEQPDFNRPFTMSAQQQQQGQAMANNNYALSKDIELISSKLDSLRVSLDMINQRLSNIERMNEREQVRKKTGW